MCSSISTRLTSTQFHRGSSALHGLNHRVMQQCTIPHSTRVKYLVKYLMHKGINSQAGAHLQLATPALRGQVKHILVSQPAEGVILQETQPLQVSGVSQSSRAGCKANTGHCREVTTTPGCPWAKDPSCGGDI